MLMTSLAVAPAMIRHRRYLPKSHEFDAKLSYLWFDPDQMDSITRQSWLWSLRHWSVLRLDADDFLLAEHGSIQEKVKKILLKRQSQLFKSLK